MSSVAWNLSPVFSTLILFHILFQVLPLCELKLTFYEEKNFAAFFVLQGDKLLIWSHLQCDTRNLLCLISDKIILKKFTHVDMYWELLGNY